MNIIMNTQKTDAPSMSADFDRIYRSPYHWFWTDIRIPKELKALLATAKPRNVLELGCGLGRFSAYVAEQGVHATGVDFSKVAIEKAVGRVAGNPYQPMFMVGDVTHLDMPDAPFDASFDVGCFHCLHKENMYRYVSEIYRLLQPGATHLIWALYNSPCEIEIHPKYIRQIFGDKFQLVKSKFSRRRVLASYWYWLVKK